MIKVLIGSHREKSILHDEKMYRWERSKLMRPKKQTVSNTLQKPQATKKKKGGCGCGKKKTR